MNCDLYATYAEVNEACDLEGERALTNGRNVENPTVIVGVNKWIWEGFDENGPDLGYLGLEMCEHVPVNDKYDLFIYRMN